MASKWADYVITAVRFNAAKTHIDRVRTYTHDGERLLNLTEMSRADVVKKLDVDKKTFVTAFYENGTWRKGSDVFVVVVNSAKYIKTKRDSIEKDNLDNLPTF